MLLHNRYFLYFIFLIALADFLYLGYIEDIHSVSIFILVGLLTAFFSKNMIVVLSSTLIITNILKCSGIKQSDLLEGLENKDDDEEEQAEGEDEREPEDEEKGEEKVNGKEKGKTKTTKLGVIKEEFGQDEKVVYTSAEDQKYGDEEKMVLAHENLLKKMNKYKPLLDTLSGLTKNIATMKQLGQEAKAISDDNTEEYKKETADLKQKDTKSKSN